MDVVSSIELQDDDSLKEKVKAALACIQRTTDLYSFEGVAFSFNGGKDSTVLLHLLRAAVALRLQAEPSVREHGLGGMTTFIFERADDFAEILDFVHDADRRYKLRVEELEGDFKSGLCDLLSRTPVRAVILGTRRGDPNAGGQDIFCPSSADWPPFMRVNPILDWNYSDVWAFLRATGVPYCSLYDQGYTSVGSINNTAPNSSLMKQDGSYAPAHMLADSRMERAGRVSKKVSQDEETPALTKRAALLIVGDEILSGKVADLNSRLLCKELFLLGWRVCKIVTIPDEVGAISEEVRAASEAHDIVITTGGVGPTLDDVTMAGVARALGYSLTHDHDLESRLRQYFGEDITSAHLKLAETPSEEVELLDFPMADGQLSPFPIVCCRNIYILPGIPSLLQQKWKVLREHLRKGAPLPSFHSIALRLSITDETHIAPALESVASHLGSAVSMGSYPVSGQTDGAGVVLSLESKDSALLQQARGQLLGQLPPGCLVSEERDSPELSRRRWSMSQLSSPSRTTSPGLPPLCNSASISQLTPNGV